MNIFKLHLKLAPAVSQILKIKITWNWDSDESDDEDVEAEDDDVGRCDEEDLGPEVEFFDLKQNEKWIKRMENEWKMNVKWM